MRTVEEQQRGISFRSSVEAIKDAVPLEDYAAGLTDLKNAGGNLVGLCPLPDHEEKTPSFHVYPDGHFHCYGCEAHGDVLDLHQLAHGHAEKWEALVSLAMDRGVELPGRSEGRKNRDARRAAMLSAVLRMRADVINEKLFRVFVLPVIDACYGSEAGHTPSGVSERERELEKRWREWERLDVGGRLAHKGLLRDPR